MTLRRFRSVRSVVFYLVVVVFAALIAVGASADRFSLFQAFAGGALFDDRPGAVTATNGKIAYQRGPNASSDVYTITPGTGISTGLRRGYHPAYSPDGTKIVFVDNTAGATNGFLMLMNADGSNVRQLSTPRQGFSPTWSPDGQRLAIVRGDFDSVGETGKGALYVVDMAAGSEGANETQIAITQIVSKPGWGATNRIAFGGLKNHVGGGYDVLGVCVTSTIPPTNQIAGNPPTVSAISGANTNDREPAWSSDGLSLAFISTRDYPSLSSSEIYVSDAAGGSVRRVTTSASFKTGPAWSPDGTLIAYSQNGTQGASNANIRTANSNGAAGTGFVTNFSSGDGFPNWGAAPPAATPTPTPTPTGADLSVSLISVSTDTPSVDREISYTIWLRNQGPQASANTIAEIRLPANTQLISEIASCTRAVSSRNVSCNIGSMPTGTERFFQVKVRPTAPGPITLAGNVQSTSADATPNDRSTSRVLQVTDVPRPANDNFANAQLLTGDHLTTAGSNVNATIERANSTIDALGEITHARVAANKSVWYLWMAPAKPGTAKISTAGSAFDTLLDVREFTQSPLPVIAYNDDSGSLSTSSLSFRYQPQTAYYIAVDGFKGASGSISLKLDVTLFEDPGEYKVVQRITGFSPSATCSEVSDPNDLLCSNKREANGFLRLTIKGQNFTPDSKVLIDGEPPTGRDRSGNPVVGETVFISSTELLVRVPPDPPLLVQKIADAGVVTSVTLNTGNAASSSQVFKAVAANTGLLKVLDLQNAIIPPNETREICGARLFNKEGGQTCMSMINFGPGTIKVSPTWFAALAYCKNSKGESNLQCAEKLASGKSFALNPQSGAPGRIEIKQSFALPPGTTIPAGLKPQVLVTGGLPLISDNGAILVGNDGGTLVGNDGGTLVGNDGGTLISDNGAILVGNDGGTLIGNDGSTLRISAGSLIGNDGSTRGELFGLDWKRSQPTVENTSPPSPLSPGDLVTGSAGYVVASGSGGSEPTVTYSYDEVTGEAFATVSLMLDNTSSPKVTNLNNIVFSIGLNPAVIKLQSETVTVDEGAGFATVTVVRNGDTSVPATFEYTTHQNSDIVSCVPGTGTPGNAGDRCDFTTTLGAVLFAANETSKEIRIPIIDDKYSEGNETFKVILGNALGAAVQMPSAATITITDNDSANGPSNPLDAADAQFLVRQQYLDLLRREPSAAELTAGADPIAQCGIDLACRKAKTIDLSHTILLQSQQAAGYVFRLYRGAFGNNQPFPIPDTSNLIEAKKWPAYSTTTRDLETLTGGQSQAQKQLALANSFVLQRAFTDRYPLDTLADGPAFVDAVLMTLKNDSGADLISQRTFLINEFDQAGGSMSGRAAVMYRLADASQTNPISNLPFINAEDSRSFTSMLYAGYLKRDGDVAGLNSLLTQLQAASDRKPFVDQFVNGVEYRLRFGPVASVTVSGRVLTPSGGVLKNATVSLTTPQGMRRTTTTNSFGLFSFSDVANGSSFTVSVSSKRYRFSPRTLQVNGNAALGDFFGLE